MTVWIAAQGVNVSVSAVQQAREFEENMLSLARSDVDAVGLCA